MKTIKKILSVLLVIGGVGMASEGSILSGICLIILGILLFPLTSTKIKESIKLWNKKGVRYGSYVLLFIFVGAFSNELKETSSISDITINKTSNYQNFLDKVKSNVNSLSEERKTSRKNIEDKLMTTETYKILVLNKIVSTEYLPLITAINNGLRNIYIKNNEELFAIDQDLVKRVENSNNGKDKLDFVIKASVLSTPNKGGYPKELVNVFDRYRKKFGLYNMPSKVYSVNGEAEKSIEYSYNMTSIFYHIEPNNKTLNAVYEANKKGAGRWFGYTKGQDYMYEYLATKKGYLAYAKQVNPNSPYILKVDYEITANQLYKAYNTNEISADDKYKGKKLAVTGIISDISEIMGKISVDLKTSDGIGWTKIRCKMENRDVVSKLRKTQEITVIGICEGLTLNISIDLDDCEVWQE
tara:strand:+ start:361 stop:1599 length:1239 start_codon:yes stop_codon:yes gene_type:complete